MQVPDPSAPPCSSCGRLMGRNGKYRDGSQRWKCKTCNSSKASDRKIGQPRKWANEAERKRAQRAKKKAQDSTHES